MQKLKPCPFCGSEFMSGVYISARWRKGTANRKMYWITCGKCRVEQCHGNSDGYRTIENAIKAWNRRAERLEELPRVDLPDRKVGKWETEVRTIHGHKIPFFACSVCGRNADDEYTYCPNCGARMERSEE